MARTKGKAVKPTTQSRIKMLRGILKRLAARVIDTPNEPHLLKYLAGCERKLCTFDPDSLNWTDYAGKSEERKAHPKKFVPLRVVPVLPPSNDDDAPLEDGDAPEEKKRKKKKSRSAIDEK